MDSYPVSPQSRVSDLFWQSVWLAKEAAPFIETEPLLIGDARPLWIDYSENQGFVNVDVLKANDVYGVVGRAGRPWMSVYRDPLFAPVYDQAGELDLYRTSYHVIHTDKDVVAQTDLWYSVHPTRDLIPRWIDLEVDRGDAAWKKAEATWKMVELVESRDGAYPVIYSRYGLVDAWLAPYWDQEQFDKIKWALAQYLFDRTVEHPGPAALPQKVKRENVLWHQTADKIPGWPGAIGSSALDRDRWDVGDEVEMKTYIQSNWGEVIIEPPPQEIRMTILRIEEFEASKTVPVGGGWVAWASREVPEGELWTIEHMEVRMKSELNNPVGLYARDVSTGKQRILSLTYGTTIKQVGVTLRPGEKIYSGSSYQPEGETISWYFRVKVQKSEIIIPGK